MSHPIGSNTSAPSGASVTTPGFATVNTPDGNRQFTFVDITSRPSNTKPTSPVKPPKKSAPETSGAPSQPAPLCLLSVDKLPAELQSLLTGIIDGVRFAIYAPQCASAFVTPNSIADVSFGDVLVVVFPTQNNSLPANHENGQIYIIDLLYSGS